jgi:hypothetical protein
MGKFNDIQVSVLVKTEIIDGVEWFKAPTAIIGVYRSLRDALREKEKLEAGNKDEKVMFDVIHKILL